MSDENWEEMDEKAASAIRLNLVNLKEEDKAIFLLASLPTSFNHLVTMLMYGNDTLELEEVTSALLSHSKMKQDGDAQGDGLVVHSKPNRSRKKSRGSNSNNERSQSKSCAKKDIECLYCHKEGHYKNQCKELKQHLEERKNEKKAVEVASVVEEKSDDNEVDGDLLSVSSCDDALSESWFLDFACSYHMCLKKEWFDTYKPYNSTVIMGNDATCSVIGIGGAAIITLTKSSTDDTKLWHMRLGHIGSHTSKGVLDYVHSHVWGPVSSSFHRGAHYFVNFVDDYSRKSQLTQQASLSTYLPQHADTDFNILQESGERTKLDPKSRKCTFLGFEKGVKEVCEDSPKEKSTVEVSLRDNLPSDKGNDEDESQQQAQSYSIARGREKRVHKAPQKIWL
uniref:CCHC-type domain-containing protein n=1 Tax=Fagus sylvatica TaxID=28930 RepID=A0A2N9E5C8_FAGSY